MSTDLQKTFRLSRKDASQILKVSTRTLDRYIIKNTLSTKNIAGRIFLSEEEVVEFIKEKRRKKRRKPAVRKTIKSQPKSRIVSHERVEKTYDLDVSVENKFKKSKNIVEENGSNIPVEIYDLPIEKPAQYEVANIGTFDIEIDSMLNISDLDPDLSQNFEQVVKQVIDQTTESEPPLQEYIDVVAKADDLVYKKLYEEQKDEVRSFQRRLEGANYRVGQLESQVKESVPLLDHQKLLAGHKKEVFNKKILYILLAVLLAVQPIWMILTFT